MHQIEVDLQKEFRELNVRKNAGNEFFKREILQLTQSFLNKNSIHYHLLNKEDIRNIIKRYIIRKIFKKINLRNFITKLRDYGNKLYGSPAAVGGGVERKISPRPDQTEIIVKSVNYFQEYAGRGVCAKGCLVLPCGVGKTLVSLWISERLCKNKSTVSLCVGVPNILLLNQWQEKIRLIFPDVPIFVMGGKEKSKESITDFLKRNRDGHIVVTTYKSSRKVKDAMKKTAEAKFTVLILDEMHHLTSSKESKGATEELEKESLEYKHILNVCADFQLGLTATLKELYCRERKAAVFPDDNHDNDLDGCFRRDFDYLSVRQRNTHVISNTDRNIFGDIIERRCLLHAINLNVVCDYVIQTLVSCEQDLSEIHVDGLELETDGDKRLLFAAFSALKSIDCRDSHHLLFYCNSVANCKKVVRYMNILLKKKYFSLESKDLIYEKYDSETNEKKLKNNLENFQNSAAGILVCVYCLGEGYDLPLLDGVVFGENMTSNIRIVQSALRASRKNDKEPGKVSKIIVPILNVSNWLDNHENPDFKKIRETIYQMGLEDETVMEKVCVLRTKMQRQSKKSAGAKDASRNSWQSGLGDRDVDLLQTLKLRTWRRADLDLTYEKAKKIVAEKKIMSKDEYFEWCKADARLHENPQEFFRGQFVSWVDYLGIPDKYFTLEECKNRIIEISKKSPHIFLPYRLDKAGLCEKLKELDDNFPPPGLWVDYYKINSISDIIYNGIFEQKKRKTVQI
jgi:superfamily II DNA or RNA helicase